MRRLRLPQAPHEQTVWLGHFTYLSACLLAMAWVWLLYARSRHLLPLWVPSSEHVVWTPAGLCFLLGLFTTAAGVGYRRGWAVLEGLWAVAVGVVGVVFVAFAYVLN